jgi:hypothetical protein
MEKIKKGDRVCYTLKYLYFYPIRPQKYGIVKEIDKDFSVLITVRWDDGSETSSVHVRDLMLAADFMTHM